MKVRDELLQEKQADKCGLGDENCEELFDITFSYILLGLNKKLDKHFRHWKFQRNLSTVLQDQTISRDNNFHYEANMELVLRDAYSAFPTEFDSFRVVQKLQTAVNENINKEKLGPNFSAKASKIKMGKKSFSQLLGKNDEATLLTVRMKAPSRKSLRCLWNFILMRTIDYPLRDDSAEVLKAIETFYDRMEYEYSGDSFKNALKFLQLGAFSVPKTIIHHRKLSYLKTPQYHPCSTASLAC